MKREGLRLFEGCGLALAIFAAACAIVIGILLHSLISNIGFLQSPADKVRQQVEINTIHREAILQQPYEPFVVAARETAYICLFLLPLALVVWLAIKGYKQMRYLWPRHGVLPVLARHVTHGVPVDQPRPEGLVMLDRYHEEQLELARKRLPPGRNYDYRQMAMAPPNGNGNGPHSTPAPSLEDLVEEGHVGT
jgi:hypothetical protein